MKGLIPVLSGLVLLALACAPAAAPTATPLPPTPTSAPAAAPTPAVGVPAPTPVPTVTAVPVAAKAPKYGGVLRVAMEFPEGMDWDANGSTAGNKNIGRFTNLVMDRFIDWRDGPDSSCEDYTASSETGLIEAWEYLDPKTLVTHLRKGVRIHKRAPLNLDRELDAEDLKVAWQRLAENYAPATSAFQTVEKLEVKDKYTLVFQLKGFSASFLDTLSDYWTRMQPRENAKLNFGKPEEVMTGTGAYVFKRYVPGVEVVVERNPNYWLKDKRTGNQLPYLDGVITYIMPDAATRLSAMRTGKLDFYYEGTPREGEDMARTNPGIAISWCSLNNPDALAMTADTPPFNDVRVRRAVAMAIDREAFNKIFSLGRSQRNESIISPREEGYLPPEEMSPTAQLYFKHDPEAAKRLLAEAGYPKGFETRILWNSKYGVERQEKVEFLADQLSRVGIRAKIVGLADAAWRQYHEPFSKAWQPPEGPYLTVHTARAIFLIPTLQERFYPDSGRNMARITDPKVREYTDLLDSTVDKEKRLKLVREAQNYLAEQVYYIFLPDRLRASMMQPYVRDLYAKPAKDQGFRLQWAWLDR